MTPTLLLPGMMCDARLFAPQVAALPGIVIPELTGADSMAGLADRVLAEAPPRFALGGLSMGGIVAMEIIARAPERVVRLALMDTNPLAETHERQAARASQVAKVQAGGLRAVIRDEMKPNYLAAGPRKAAILDLCMEMAMATGSEVFAMQSAALRDRPDYRKTLAGVRVPTLILCGRDDALCPVARHETMHALIPGATLAIMDGAGHLPTLEQPSATSAALARWLA